MDRQKEFVLRTLEERDIRFVRLWFTDVLGYLKSVAIAPAELEVLAGAGALAVRLGPEVLRSSTAGPAALAVLSAALGRWASGTP